ncbi:MAG: 4'-phosphopantetheinyl transferase superfamily protein [Acidimicrobiales bacterium]
MPTRELDASARLGVPVSLSVVADPVSPGALAAGERAQWRALAPGPRRDEWLLGRTALKQLVPDGADTSAMTFPHPRFSLTHGGGRGVAARVEGEVVGTGVDFEPFRRSADPRSARFFLRPVEHVGVCDASSLLRLWTVKEALYKATPDNAELVLVDYEIGDATRRWGEATGPRGELMRYASMETADGQLTVAVCILGARRHGAV